MAILAGGQAGVHNGGLGGRASLHGVNSGASPRGGATNWRNSSVRGASIRLLRSPGCNCARRGRPSEGTRPSGRAPGPSCSSGLRPGRGRSQCLGCRKSWTSGSSSSRSMGWSRGAVVAPGSGALAQKKWPHPRGDSGGAVGSRGTMRALWLSAAAQDPEGASSEFPRNRP